MDKKPVTDLVLLPFLGMIPLDSIPKHRREELALEQKRRAEALVEANKSIVVTCAMVLCTGLFGWGFILALLHGSLIALWFTGAFGAIMAALSGAMAQVSASQVRAWKQVIPPQLQLEAEKEKVVSEMANIVNTQAVIWNKRGEGASAQDIDKRYLGVLKSDRAIISAKIERVKMLVESIGATKPKTDNKRRP